MVTLCLGGWTFSNNPKNINSALGCTCTRLQLSVSSSAAVERMKLFLLNTGLDAFSLHCRHHWVFNIRSLEKSEWVQVLTLYIYLLTGSVFCFLPLFYTSLSQISETYTLCLLLSLQKCKEPFDSLRHKQHEGWTTCKTTSQLFTHFNCLCSKWSWCKWGLHGLKPNSHRCCKSAQEGLIWCNHHCVGGKKLACFSSKDTSGCIHTDLGGS